MTEIAMCKENNQKIMASFSVFTCTCRPKDELALQLHVILFAPAPKTFSHWHNN